LIAGCYACRSLRYSAYGSAPYAAIDIFAALMPVVMLLDAADVADADATDTALLIRHACCYAFVFLYFAAALPLLMPCCLSRHADFRCFASIFFLLFHDAAAFRQLISFPLLPLFFADASPWPPCCFMPASAII